MKTLAGHKRGPAMIGASTDMETAMRLEYKALLMLRHAGKCAPGPDIPYIFGT